MMVRFSSWLTAGVGKFEESRAQAVTAKTHRLRRGISNPHQPRCATAAPKKHPRHRRPDHANLNRTPAPLGLCPAVEAPQQSALAATSRTILLLDKSYLCSCLAPTCSSPLVIHLLLVRPLLSSPSFLLPLVVAFDITVSKL
jgi:hypothetical protein